MLHRDQPRDVQKAKTERQEDPSTVRMSESAEALGEQFRVFVGAIPDVAIFMIDPQGTIATWNEGAKRLKGYGEQEAVGMPFAHLFTDDDRKTGEPQREMDEAAHCGRYSGTGKRRRQDGTIFDAEVSLTPTYHPDGSLRGFLKVTRDVTKERQQEQQLRVAKEEAERANAAKDQFIAVVSHELRRPLSPIITTAELLLKDATLPTAIREDVAMILRNARLEARFVDDMLDLTRIGRNSVELHHEVVDIHAVIRHALETCVNQEEGWGREVEIITNLWAKRHQVWGDATRLHQVFANLTCNALKFTPERGRVSIKTENLDGTVRVTITDTGIGIEQETLQRIFTAFEQGERTIMRKYGGMGLGLTVAKGMIDLHGGTIEAMSEGKDKGAAFRVMLPTLEVADDDALLHTVDDSPCPHKVLLVEDHPDTLRVTARMLRGAKYLVVTAATASEAMTKLTGDPEIGLIVSDLGLPDGTGHDIMRAAKRARGGVRGIAISGYGQDDDRKRSLDAGFEHHLVKPIKFEQLHDLLAALCQ